MQPAYYYIVASLPDLSLTDKDTAFDTLRFRAYVNEHLSTRDAGLLRVLYYNFDIENFIALVRNTGAPWHPYGYFSAVEIQERLETPNSLPPFLRPYTDPSEWRHLSPKALLNAITTDFLDWSRRVPNDLLRQWLAFDQNLKNLLIWLNCNKFGLDPTEEVLGHSPEAEYLRQARPHDLDLRAWDIPYREALRHYDNPDIALRERIINEMRWRHLEDLLAPYPFGIEQILGHAIKLLLIRRNMTDAETGRQRLAQITAAVRADYALPEAFNGL